MKKLNRNIEIIIAIFLCIYIPLFFGLISLKSQTLPFVGSDAVEYKNLSESLINTQIYTQDGINPEVFRSPGYPFFLAVTKGIFHNYWISIFCQILCTLGITLLAFKIGSKVFSEKIGLAASVLFLIEPSVIIYTLTISSDIPFIFLFLLSIHLLFFRKISYVNTILAGLFLGLATFTRPISLYFVVIALVFYVIIRLKEVERKVIIKNGILFFLAFFLTLLPWFMRNNNLFGKFTLSSLPGYNLFHYNIPEYESFRKNIEVGEARNNIRERLPIPVKNSDDLRRGEHINMINETSKEYLKENLFGYGIFHILKTVPFFVSSSGKNAIVMKNSILGKEGESVQYYNISSMIMKGDIQGLTKVLKAEWWIFIERLLWGILIILSLLSLFNRKDRIKWWHIVFFVITILYFAILTGPVSYVRYRLPVEPFIFLLTIPGFQFIKQKITT